MDLGGAPYNLKGWMIVWASWKQVGIDVVAALLGLIVGGIGGIFLGAIGLVLAVSGMYVATECCLHSYWDVILLYGFIPIYNEASYYTNQICPNQYLGIWWFIPVTLLEHLGTLLYGLGVGRRYAK
ncbi:hypothetical protein KEJ45_06190 [Candidatus Bathyarchaeota archaeon]|nr:hypothetical protein [Candidatus Bathyarchaeota archaeon]